MSGPGGRSGHALVELLVALPILAIGGGAIAGIVLAASAFLREAEWRLEVAAHATPLLDSLRWEAAHSPSSGHIGGPAGRAVRWEWDGGDVLSLTFLDQGGEEGPVWTFHDGGRAAGRGEP